jgi:hypothetical protein
MNEVRIHAVHGIGFSLIRAKGHAIRTKNWSIGKLKRFKLFMLSCYFRLTKDAKLKSLKRCEANTTKQARYKQGPQ